MFPQDMYNSFVYY